MDRNWHAHSEPSKMSVLSPIHWRMNMMPFVNGFISNRWTYMWYSQSKSTWKLPIANQLWDHQWASLEIRVRKMVFYRRRSIWALVPSDDQWLQSFLTEIIWEILSVFDRRPKDRQGWFCISLVPPTVERSENRYPSDWLLLYRWWKLMSGICRSYLFCRPNLPLVFGIYLSFITCSADKWQW